MASIDDKVDWSERQAYDEAYYRDQLHSLHWFHNNRRKLELRWREILRMVQPQHGDILLDLGSAVGTYTLRAAPLVARTIGVDFSETAARIATQSAADIDANVQFVVASVQHLPFAHDSVDKVMAIDLVEHIDDDDLRQMLAEVWRVLRTGGSLSIYTPCRTHYVERLKALEIFLQQTPGHIAVRTPAAYERIFQERPWHMALRYFSPSTYPGFAALDRLLAPVPVIGSLFRFRYCVVLCKR